MGGIFGVISTEPCINDLFYGTDYNSHLGTKRAGMATYSKEQGFVRAIHNIESSYFRNKFEDELDEFQGTSGIGVISDNDSQPIIVYSHLGRFALVTVAKIVNLKELEQELLLEGEHFSEQSSSGTNPTEVIALLISRGKTYAEGIRNVYKHVKGSCSMLLLTEDGVIAARDYWGRTPLVLARKEGAFAVTSESSSLPNLDYECVRDLGPGEAVRIHPDGFEVLVEPQKDMQICSFLWVYYGFPNSCYEGRNVEKVRYDCGLEMGREDHSEVDSVCGIPDSGVGVALGYAESKGIPYHRAITKYTPTWPRSFMPATQMRRSLVAKMKLIPNRTLLEGKRLMFCDDSIVRGTQLKDNVKVLFEYGAKEVHIRISCPPLVYPCPFIGFTSSRSSMELITRRIIQDFEGDENKNLEAYSQTGSPEYERMVEEIRKRLGLTSLRFNKLETLVKAIGLPKERICTHCFDGSSHF
ncbi:MAG: amidophosphoribosyltransferase [Bacteroidaceae bacterium]|nr:amidophosphoribosyltransferase [Bacteroidaceae bacterium]